MIYKKAGLKEQRGKLGSKIHVLAWNMERCCKPWELTELFVKQNQFHKAHSKNIAKDLWVRFVLNFIMHGHTQAKRVLLYIYIYTCIFL